MGIFPNHFLSWSSSSINHLTENQASYRLSVISEDPVMEMVPPADQVVPLNEGELDDGGLREDIK